MKVALYAVVAVLFAVLLVQPGSLSAQKGKPIVVKDILLQATLRDGSADGVLSDGLGSYSGDIPNVNKIKIDADGNAHFSLGPQSGRTIRLSFSDQLRPGGPGLFPPGDDERVEGHSFFTMTVGAPPTLNFRTMIPGQVAPVRLWFTFNTAGSTEYFWLRADPDTSCGHCSTGAVQVTALDMDADGNVDRWVIEPLPVTDSKFQLLQHIYIRKTRTTVIEDYGDYRMPFQIWLDRLN